MPETPLPVLFAQARGARLAYQIWGDGPVTVVGIPPLAQNIEAAWESPLISRMLERFGTFSRYLHFDKRGTGASDRRSQMPGIDERVDDVRAVMDAAGIGSASFFVQSDGGPTALFFAATYPDRVERLVFFGSAANMAHPWTEAERVARRDRMVAEWGTPDSRIVDGFAPSLAGDQDFRTWHQRYERQAASPQSLRDLLDLASEIDATEVLASVAAPALIVHRRGERVIPLAWAIQLADALPDARLLELAGDDHFAYVGDLDEWMPDVERFLTGGVRPHRSPPPSRSVRIVTLGGFGVEVNGERLPVSVWGSRLARQLCKRLVAARGWPVTRDELIDLLWPDETDLRRLGARLSVLLSSVRRVLGGGVIADRQTVRLDLEEVSTDLEDLYKAVDDAAVVAAYAGEFLPEDRYEDWTMAPRDEARARFLSAARRRAEREIAHDNPLVAASLGWRMVESQPYDNGSHQLLVDALMQAGEHGEARRAHEAWVQRMAELGVSVPDFEAISES